MPGWIGPEEVTEKDWPVGMRFSLGLLFGRFVDEVREGGWWAVEEWDEVPPRS